MTRILIVIEGDRGTGKSTIAAGLAVVHPDAIVVDEHKYGALPSDRLINHGRYIWIGNAGIDQVGRTRGIQKVILVGDVRHHEFVKRHILSRPFDVNQHIACGVEVIAPAG